MPGRDSYSQLPSNSVLTPKNKTNKISSFFAKEQVAFFQDKVFGTDGYCFREFDRNFQMIHTVKKIVVKNTNDFEFEGDEIDLVKNPLFIPKRVS